MVEEIKKAVAKLQCGEKSGTAFMINENTALTVSHCILEAIEEDREITLIFYNIEGREAFPVRAFWVPDKNQYPVSVLKLEEPVETKYLELACYSDQIRRKEEMFSYGYLDIEGVEGYPLDLYVNQYLNENMPCHYDIVLLPDGKNNVKDYSGMSGSPIIYRNYVIGILTEENLEVMKDDCQAIDLKVISNKKVVKLFVDQNIPFINMSYWEIEQAEKNLQIPKEYQNTEYSFDNRQRNYREGFVTRNVEYSIAVGDYEDSVQRELERIFMDKNQGKWEMAWRGLLDLTEQVKGSKSKPKNTLAKLYYIRAIWYLDDKNDMHNAQKYWQKALEHDPEYDCRTYHAKRYLLEGNIIEEKKVLLPLNNVSVLNTYLQACIFKKELEDAVAAYRVGEQLADHSTHYLMALVYILDGEYEMAEEHLDRAEQTIKDAPLYLMMRGVIRYWKLLPPGMVYGDNLLPPMYFHAMILPDTYMQDEMRDIEAFYQKAFTLAEMADNAELQKQILIVWLNTLSISEFYREKGKKVAEKLLRIDQYQCQGIIYLYMAGEDLSAIDVEGVEKLLKRNGNQIEHVISCIYLYLGKKDERKAYARLKEFRFKFEELHMMEYWYDLAVRSCHDKEEIQKLREGMEKSSLDDDMKARVEGLLLESLQEYEELYQHAERLYNQTGKEIDIVNLIHCCERTKKWEDAEKYCRIWDKSFGNPMAKIHIIRCLAMQNRQEECLKGIDALYKAGKMEYVTDEVLYLEAQALKILGKFKEAIEKSDELWERSPNQRTLFLLAECYFLNGEEQSTISILKDGLHKGIKSVAVYQMLAGHERRYDAREAAKHAKQACIVSDGAPEVMLWAMNFLFQIGESEKANELLLKLQAINQTDFFRQMTFREAKEWMERAEKECEQIFAAYKNCQFPYHVLIDSLGPASYTLYCHRLWNFNQDQNVKKQPLFAVFGGHHAEKDILEQSVGNSISFDFSTLIHLKHLDLLEESKSCWKCIFLSGEINRLIAYEQNICLPFQPDITVNEKKMVAAWKKRKINYLSRPDEEKAKGWMMLHVELADVVPCKTAKEHHLFWISDHFLTDWMENSEWLPKEMRKANVTVSELFEALERRGDISAELKMRYVDDMKGELRGDVVESLVSYTGKIPVLVDNSFLEKIYALDAVSIISQKCEIYVFDNVFDRYEKRVKDEEDGRAVIDFLEDLKADIAEGAEEGRLRFFGYYRDDSIKASGDHTGMLLNMMNYSLDKKCACVCDDRWLNSFHDFEDTYIYNMMDIIELMHDKKILTDEKYLDVITQMLSEGYCYIVPPVTYMRLLILQTDDTGNILREVPEELLLVCRYLVNVTASENKLMDEVIHPGVLPESVAFINRIQENLRYLLKEVWGAKRSNEWKQGISSWLLLNYSAFAYRSVMNKNDNEPSRDYFAMQLSDLIFSGFVEMPAGYHRAQYYRWLFQWMALRMNIETGLEDRVLYWLAHIINEVYQKARETYYGIGIGALTLSATEDMPAYYAKKICENPLLVPIIEEFEGMFIILGGKEIIERKVFNQWLEEAMKSGLNQGLRRKKHKDSQQEYEIIWIVDDLLSQGYQIQWRENDGSTKRIYFRMEGAMLLCDDKILRMKGLYALKEYVDGSNMKAYEININRSELRGQTAEEVIAEVKLSEHYYVHILRYILKKKHYRLYPIDELLPEEPDYFDKNTEGSIDDEQNMSLYQDWADRKETILAAVFMELVVYIFGSMCQRRNYQGRDGRECLHWAFCHADMLLNQILLCHEEEGSDYSFEEIDSFLNSENERKGFYHLFKDKKRVYDGEEMEAFEKKAEQFLAEEIDGAAYEAVEQFCTQLGYASPGFVLQVLPELKQWIESQWKNEEKQDEIYLLQIMQHVAMLEDGENMAACYIAFWNDILDKNQKIVMSMEAITVMKSLVMAMGFEQGEKIREIVERICLM